MADEKTSKTNYDLHLRGYVGGWDFDADYVDWVVANHSGGELRVLIDSLGGELATALSVAASFRRHGNVSVHYSGMNASAATIAGMGAARISIDSNALWLVHNASYFIDKFTQANAKTCTELIEELEKKKNDLETFDRSIAENYASRCRRTPEELSRLMAQERWLTAAEAKEWGFVDEVVVVDKPQDVPKSVVLAMNEAGLPIPKELRGMAGSRIERALERIMSSLGISRKDDHVGASENESGKEPVSEHSDAACEAMAGAHEEPAPSENNNETINTNPINMENNITSAQEKEAIQTPTPANDNNELAQLRSEIATLKAELAEAKKAPGDETTNVVTAHQGGAGSQLPGQSKSEIDRYAHDMADAVQLMATLP